MIAKIFLAFDGHESYEGFVFGNAVESGSFHAGIHENAESGPGKVSVMPACLRAESVRHRTEREIVCFKTVFEDQLPDNGKGSVMAGDDF